LKYFFFLCELGLGGDYFWNCPNGDYEVLIRPKSKVGFEDETPITPVSISGEGLLSKDKACPGRVKTIMACGWTIPKRITPNTPGLKSQG
jgi:hypothetical protein